MQHMTWLRQRDIHLGPPPLRWCQPRRTKIGQSSISWGMPSGPWDTPHIAPRQMRHRVLYPHRRGRYRHGLKQSEANLIAARNSVRLYCGGEAIQKLRSCLRIAGVMGRRGADTGPLGAASLLTPFSTSCRRGSVDPAWFRVSQSN